MPPLLLASLLSYDNQSIAHLLSYIICIWGLRITLCTYDEQVTAAVVAAAVDLAGILGKKRKPNRRIVRCIYPNLLPKPPIPKGIDQSPWVSLYHQSSNTVYYPLLSIPLNSNHLLSNKEYPPNRRIVRYIYSYLHHAPISNQSPWVSVYRKSSNTLHYSLLSSNKENLPNCRIVRCIYSYLLHLAPIPNQPHWVSF